MSRTAAPDHLTISGCLVEVADPEVPALMMWVFCVVVRPGAEDIVIGAEGD